MSSGMLLDMGLSLIHSIGLHVMTSLPVHFAYRIANQVHERIFSLNVSGVAINISLISTMFLLRLR